MTSSATLSNAPDKSTSANASAHSDPELQLPKKKEEQQSPERTAAQPNVGDGDADARTTKKVYAVSVRWEDEQRQREIRRQSLESGPVDRSKPFLTFTVEDFNCFCCCARQVGALQFLLERRDGSPIVVAGPCWPFCMFVTVPLIVGLSAMVGFFIVSKDSRLPWWFALIYYPIIGFVLMVLFCVSCRDPGLMERVTDEEAAADGWYWNEQVGSYRPAAAMYCRECKALVYEYDHVCPWTGTAIGRGNKLPFKMFVFSVNVLCYFSIGLVIWQVMANITS